MTEEAINRTEERINPVFQHWAIVELMGHVRMAGRVTEEEHFGTKLGRIDIPVGYKGTDEWDNFATQYFAGSAIYRVTPCDEDVARAVAKQNKPEPVHSWEFPAEEVEEIEQPARIRQYADMSAFDPE
jgi:hypothetical protein